MKMLFEWNNKTLIIAPERMDELIKLIMQSAEEVYEHKKNWSTKEESHHVYPISACDFGVQEIRVLSDELYALGKLRGKPEE